MAMRTEFIHADGTKGLPHDASGLPVGWSLWHCARLCDAMESEGYEKAKYYVDEYTFTVDHMFIAPETDVWSRGGEPNVDYIFEIHAGDTYRCWRD